jgi:hypothetical protein
MNREFFENPVELRTSVRTPHFADRRAVMRAQPVVPLNEIRTKLRLRRLWFLSGAFAIAMMLGVASALVAVQVKRMAANTGNPQIAEPAAATTAVTQLPAVPDAPIVDSGEQIANSATVAETPVKQPAPLVVTTPKRQEPLAQRPRIVNSHRDSRDGEPSEEEQLEQIREAVLYERWQERRARRAVRRERRNRAYDRDLSRVDELFEGPRRPERPY